jgi:hypothetical protein
MGVLKSITEWATSPWGQDVPIHIAWFLIWVAALAGLLFLIVHAIYVRYFAKAEEFADNVPPAHQAVLPERIPRHSLAARLFHWIMAASMFTLLFTAFLPKIGLQFNWVTYHWIAGSLLTVSILFHIIHASFWLDFWAIWPDKADMIDAWRRVRRFMGRPAQPPRRFAKYPLENKLYHVYFAVRPEKLDITKSMIFGSMRREFYLKHYDPQRWTVEVPRPGTTQAKEES